MAPALASARAVLASLRSAAVFGVDAYPVPIEVDVSLGLPHFPMVGLPDATVRESRDRVRSPIKNSGSNVFWANDVCGDSFGGAIAYTSIVVSPVR